MDQRLTQTARYVIPLDPDGSWKTADHFAFALEAALYHHVPPDRIHATQIDWLAASSRKDLRTRPAREGDDTRRLNRPVILTMSDRVKRHLARFPNQHRGMFEFRQLPSAGDILRMEIVDLAPGIDIIECVVRREWGEHPLPGEEALNLSPKPEKPGRSTLNPRVQRIVNGKERVTRRKK